MSESPVNPSEITKAVGFCVLQVLLEDVDVIYEKSWSTSNVPWIEVLSRR